MCDVYVSKDMGLLVVFVARKSAVSLKDAVSKDAGRQSRSISLVHYILRVPIHNSIFQIEPLEI